MPFQFLAGTRANPLPSASPAATRELEPQGLVAARFSISFPRATCRYHRVIWRCAKTKKTSCHSDAVSAPPCLRVLVQRHRQRHREHLLQRLERARSAQARLLFPSLPFQGCTQSSSYWRGRRSCKGARSPFPASGNVRSARCVRGREREEPCGAGARGDAEGGCICGKLRPQV